MDIKEVIDDILAEMIASVNTKLDEKINEYSQKGVDKYEIMAGIVDELDINNNVVVEEILEHINEMMEVGGVLP